MVAFVMLVTWITVFRCWSIIAALIMATAFMFPRRYAGVSGQVTAVAADSGCSGVGDQGN